MASYQQLKDSAKGWLEDFHAHGDALDAKAWIDKFYSSDVILQFGNYPPIEGAENVRSMFQQQFVFLKSMKHRFTDFDVINDKIYQPATITYVVADDPDNIEITIPGFALVYFPPGTTAKGDFQGAKMTKFEVFIDTSPVMNRKAAVKAMRA